MVKLAKAPFMERSVIGFRVFVSKEGMIWRARVRNPIVPPRRFGPWGRASGDQGSEKFGGVEAPAPRALGDEAPLPGSLDPNI